MAGGSSLLARRERQILDIIFARGQASAADIQESAFRSADVFHVRAILRIMEKKGRVRHKAVGRQYVYFAVTSRRRAAK